MTKTFSTSVFIKIHKTEDLDGAILTFKNFHGCHSFNHFLLLYGMFFCKYRCESIVLGNLRGEIAQLP
jgi:hypothetical protein